VETRKTGDDSEAKFLDSAFVREVFYLSGGKRRRMGIGTPFSLSNIGVEHQTRQVPVTVVKTLFFDPPRKRA
jgi:hypothetical protein